MTPDLRIKLFLDTADVDACRTAPSWVAGFTTNPTLMRRAGVTNYRAFVTEMLAAVGGRPVSFEVVADEFDEMEAQARILAACGENVYVKIPVTNTRGETSVPLIKRLAARGVRVNVTAVMTFKQIVDVTAALEAERTPSILSVFVGRIADTGCDPSHRIETAVDLARGTQIEVLWASPRAVADAYQANECGCHIITLTPELMARLDLYGKNIGEYSLETVRMFRRDALAAALGLKEE